MLLRVRQYFLLSILFLFFLLFSFDTEIILELCRIFLPIPCGRQLHGTPRGEVVILFLGGGVPPGPESPYPISNQNIRFSIPYFRPDSQKQMHTLLQTLWCVANSATLNRSTAYGTSWRPKRCSCCFFFAINVHGSTRYSKSGILDRIDGIYTLFQTKTAKSIPYFRLEMPPPPPPGMQHQFCAVKILHIFLLQLHSVFSSASYILIFRNTGEYPWEVQGHRSLPDPIPLVPHGTQFGRHPHWTKTGEKEQRWLPSHWQSRQDARDIPVAWRIERSQTTPIRFVGGRPCDGQDHVLSEVDVRLGRR